MNIQVRELTLNFVMSANLPFSIVENKEFNELASYISNDKAELCSRKTLMKDLTVRTNTIKRKLIDIIDKTDYICTTADVWTSMGKSFLGTTIHYFDENLDKQSFMLAFRRLRGRHTYDKLADAILEIHKDFNLKRSKITHIVTDGGSSFCKAFRQFGANDFEKNGDKIETDDTFEQDVEIDIENMLELEDLNDDQMENVIAEVLDLRSNTDDVSYFRDDFETLPKQQRCIPHSLNLIGSNDFEKELKGDTPKCHDALGSAYEKLKSFWNLSRKSSVAKEIIEKTCDRSFPYPNNTRWNGKFDCIEVANDNSKNINIAIDEINKEAKKHTSNRRAAKTLEKLTPADWRCLRDYTIVLRPVSIALDILQGEKRACQGYVMPSLFSIVAHLRNIANNDGYVSEYGRVMHRCMMKCLERRFGHMLKFDEENNDLILAAVLHPNFKLSWIEKESDKEYAQSLLINKYVSLANLKKSQHFDDSEENVAPVEKQKSKENDFFKHLRTNERRTSTDDALTMEIWKYILQPISDDTVIQTNQLKSLPVLEELFRLYNTTLSSSAPVERLFSNASLVFTSQRNRTSDEHFECALFVRRNSKLLNQNGLA